MRSKYIEYRDGMPSEVWHNEDLRSLFGAGRWGRDDFDRLTDALGRHGTLTMPPLPSGLFGAAAVDPDDVSGYGHVWVRDNVYVAYGHHAAGRPEVAGRIARALLDFYHAHRFRFDDVINGGADPADVMCRPHIRFDGVTLRESAQQWPHAQNDALGYALWLYATLAAAEVVVLDEQAIRTLALFPRYFAAIRYWADEDSGHWEETRRRSAASIGVAMAGLDRLAGLTRARAKVFAAAGFTAPLVDLTFELAGRGRAALDSILPSECAQISPAQNRRYDAALIFLIHPLGVVSQPMADLILADVDRYLTSTRGVRRYLGDSYWAPDYDELLRAEDRTRDFSEDVQSRDALLDRIGHEAEWCIFDPMLSALYGRRFLATGSLDDRDRQRHHLERALSQITADWQCPELYYLRGGAWVPNPHTPLRWTQANLLAALAAVRLPG